MKNSIYLILFVLVTNFGFSQNKSSHSAILIEYERPYDYVQAENNLLVKAFLKLNIASGFDSIELNNGYISKIKYENDKAWAWLPVFGQPEIMKIVATNTGLTQEQLFTPLVTSDWDYFKDGTFHIISSSHQDIAWMDTPEHCRHERINDIIVPALDVMKTDKAYHFGMEQALNLKEFIEEHPERKDEVIERNKEGRFTWGATYNQPYEGMQMGEQLIREMYFGKKWIKDNFKGCDAKTAFNTDVPGRTLQFPQILAKSGVKNLFVSRMKEGFYDWTSPDGSSVLTYTPGNYGWAVIFYRLFDEDALEAMRKIQNRVKMWSDYYGERNLPPHFAIVISNDASGPTNYGKVVKEWNGIVRNTGIKIPTLKHATVSSFMAEINKEGAKFDKLEGDRPNIWSYIHGPGHHKAVTASRKAGRMLPSAEIFSTIDALVHNNTFKNYPSKELSNAFEESIYPDHGWGGKNGHITDSIFRSKLEFAANESDRLIKNSLSSISNKIKTRKSRAVIVYNDLSWERNDVASVKIENPSNYYVVNKEGKAVPSQVVTKNDEKVIQFVANKVPSLGYSTFYLIKGKKDLKVNKEVTPNSLTNDFYTIQLGDGGIRSLFDHSLNKDVIKSTKFSGGDVLTLEYTGNGAGEFTQMTKPEMKGVFDPNGKSHNAGYDRTSKHTSQWRVINDGNVFTQYESKTLFKHTQIVQKIKVFHHEKKIDFSIDMINWDGTHNREFRFAVPLNMDNAKIKYEVPLAIAEVGKTEMKEAPKGWAWGGTYDSKPTTIHPREVLNYIASETKEFALTMATDVALADWIDPTREAVDYPVLQGLLLASHKSCHGEGNWYHQTGDHHFKFSIKSHKPSDKTSYQFGTSSNHPLRTVLKIKTNKEGKLPSDMSFFNVSDSMVRISTIKKSEDDDNVIMRLVEMGGSDKQTTVNLSQPFSELIKTNLIEEEENNINQSGKNMDISIGKNAIETYKIIYNK
ncbi:glycosyl hydrolase-related protein [Flavivirga spongiicola]|uniref:Glycosyl hydrolase-related protein n=1 Tax=Flavivirga spongiicola TaxID=421621 RepID=A0ABU7XSH8_9FLAO|nr:glycosyl hydrolase-related protein [Flavivirga sp. MEBiC05379]MDO5977894.1 glycosyl hydrolase-related protein [Flavivirga sp. MEBiC05379]